MITEWNDIALLSAIDRIKDEANEKGAQAVAATARRNVKKDTRDLEISIIVKKSKFKDGGHIVEASGGKKFHASFVELGTSKDMKQPFLRPALAANRRKIFKNFENKLK